jgi:hypothetical protein
MSDLVGEVERLETILGELTPLLQDSLSDDERQQGEEFVNFISLSQQWVFKLLQILITHAPQLREIIERSK